MGKQKLPDLKHTAKAKDTVQNPSQLRGINHLEAIRNFPSISWIIICNMLGNIPKLRQYLIHVEGKYPGKKLETRNYKNPARARETVQNPAQLRGITHLEIIGNFPSIKLDNNL